MPTARIHLRVCKIKPTKLQRSCILTWWTLGRLFESSSHAPPRLQLVHSAPPLLPAPCLLHAVPVQPLVEKYLTDSIPAALASPFMRSGQKEQNIVWVSRREFMILKKELPSSLFFLDFENIMKEFMSRCQELEKDAKILAMKFLFQPITGEDL